MSEKIKTAVMEVIKAHMDGEDKNTKAVLSDVMQSVNELETLEQEPCDDAISREAVLDALLDYWHDIQFVDGSGYDVYEDCKAVIDELPSVTQKSETVTEFADRCRECGRERVLDKIRAEIEFEVDHRNNMLCAEDVFEIIDKYIKGENK